MPHDHQFGLFVEDEKEQLWRGFFDDLEAAKKAVKNSPTKKVLSSSSSTSRTLAR
jgi:hypothetical protein